MPRTYAPARPSPIDSLKIGRRRIKVGDEVTLTLKVRRIGPYGRGEDRPGVTVMLPDGNLCTLPPDYLLQE